MTGVEYVGEKVGVVGELSVAYDVSKDRLNRYLYKRFSEDLVEVRRVEYSGDMLKVWVESSVLCVSELRSFWLDIRFDLASEVSSEVDATLVDATLVDATLVDVTLVESDNDLGTELGN